jgi:hypothetical protein
MLAGLARILKPPCDVRCKFMNATTTTGLASSNPIGVLRTVLPSVLCVTAGFLSGFTVSFIGQIPVGELILCAVFPWVIVRCVVHKGWPTLMQQLKWYKILMFLVGLMALGYVMSDLYRGTSSDNLIRGWARVGFLAVDLVSLAYLMDGSWARFQATFLALYIGATLNAVITGPLFGLWWEFGFGYTVTVLVLYLFAGRPAWVQIITTFLMAAISMALGGRSLGGICLLVGILYGLRYARGIFRPVAIFAALGALVLLLAEANTVILQNLGKEGSSLERQSMIETAGEAFLSSPFIGQGSWFTSSGKMLAQLEENRQQLDPKFHHYSEDEGRQIAIHSQILVALAEGGILGGGFFIFYGMLLLKTLNSLTRTLVPHRAFIFYVVIAGLWNLCMSPFSGVARVEICLAIFACLLVVMQRNGELPENFRE